MQISTQTIKPRAHSYLGSLFLLMASAFLFVGCAAAPDFQSIGASQTKGPDGDDSQDQGSKDEEPGNYIDTEFPRDDEQKIICESGTGGYEEFEITADAAQAVNVLFVIDDSGSMGGEFNKVKNNIENFTTDLASRIADNPESNIKVGMLFRHDRSTNDELTGIINSYDFVSKANAPTWSKWADLAFWQAFAGMDSMQPISDVPADNPYYAPTDTLFDDYRDRKYCQREGGSYGGVYFRPRQLPSAWATGAGANFFHTPACGYSEDYADFDLGSFFSPNARMNMITISDDDLNVAWDREGFVHGDPVLQSYPKFVHQMYREVFDQAGLKKNYLYHSIVGLDQGDFGVEEAGNSHLALSRKTGGLTADITLNSWDALFADLAEAIIFSEQSAELSCEPSAASVVVTINGEFLDEEHYTVNANQQTVQILPSAFDSMSIPSGETVTLKVAYLVP